MKFNLLGIDLGTSFTGFSLYDKQNVRIYDLHYSERYSPHDVTLYTKVLYIVKKESIGGIVIGKPSKNSQYIDQFTDGLESYLSTNKLDLYITHVNEDMTTAKAQKLSRSNNMYFNDGMAAMLIL